MDQDKGITPSDAGIPPTATVGQETLDETPERALKLLRAIGTSKPIQALMHAGGYRKKHHADGWARLTATAGYAPGDALPEMDEVVREAIIAIDAADEDLFEVVDASLSAHFPDQAKFVLTGLSAAKGAESVIGTKSLLHRLNVLENGAERQPTRQQDRAALDLLAERGIGPARRAELADLVQQAESLSAPVDAPADEVEREARHQAALVAMRAWYAEWSRIARVKLKHRRDYLIRCGLAKRKSPAKKGSGEDDINPS